jgi:hypothetical protein
VERQWAAKAPIHLARLALVLHQLAGPKAHRELAAETMAAAIDLLEYFRAHLSRVLPAFGARTRAGTQTRILRILRSTQTAADGWVGRSEIGTALRTIRPREMTATLERLLAEGVVERDVRKSATKPSEWWRLVPDSASTIGGEDSDYSDYSSGDGSQGTWHPLVTGENPNNPNLPNGFEKDLAHDASRVPSVIANEAPSSSHLAVVENETKSTDEEPLQETFL